MNYHQSRSVSVGDALRGTFYEIAALRREIGIYLLVFVGFGVFQWSVDYFVKSLAWIVSIGGIALYFYAQYRLYQAMLRKRGIAVDPRVRGFSFAGLAILIAMGMGLASNLFVVPALILGARWITAPIYMVSENQSIMGSLGESWRVSSGNTFPLTIVYTLFWTIWLVAFSVISSVGDSAKLVTDYTPLIGFAWHLLPIMMMAFPMTVFEMLNDTARSTADIFE